MNQFSGEAKKEVERLLQQGQKLQAIQYLTDNVGTTPDESNMLVEVLEKEMSSAQVPQSIAEQTTVIAASTALPEHIRTEVVKMLQANQKIEAIKFVRQHLGAGLQEGLLLVEGVEKDINPNYRSVKAGGGCLKGTVKVLSVIVGFIAFLMFAVAIIVYFVQEQTISNGDRIQGVVTDLKTTSDGTAPIISYEWKGQKKVYEGTLYSTPPEYEINEQVWMFITRDGDEQIVIDNFTERWLAITVFGVTGGFLTLFSILFAFGARKILSSQNN